MMDYKAALIKGLTEIPSSSSIKLRYKNRRPAPKINLLRLWSSSSMLQQEGNNHNWPNLPPDVMLLILQRVGWCDVLMNVKQVCKYWYVLSKDPSLWRVIDFREYTSRKKVSAKKLIMDVIDLSCGQLQDLVIQYFGSDDLFKYIYPRSRQLRRLRLQECFVCCYNYESHDYDRYITLKGMIQMLKNLPFLEILELPYTRIFGKGIEIVGRHCPNLKSFTLNQRAYLYSRNPKCDKQALAIAKSMPGLRHLQLFGNRMTITGLMAILNKCHHLEYLDLRQCYGLCRVLEDEPDLEKKLRQQIKHVRFPQDSTEDYEFDDSTYDSDDHIGSDCSSELD